MDKDGLYVDNRKPYNIIVVFIPPNFTCRYQLMELHYCICILCATLEYSLRMSIISKGSKLLHII